MHLNRLTRIQLVIFMVIALTAMALMAFNYMKLPATWLGIGHYTVTVELPRSGGLYDSSNVTYRGAEVGRVRSLRLTDTGVAAEISLNSKFVIPRDLKAEVHSRSAIGEQYIDLLPSSDTSPRLRNGDVIPMASTSVPPDINNVLDDVVTGLRAIPRENLKTVVDESYTAVGGLGPELSRLVKGTTDLSIDARANLDPLVTLIDDARPLLDSQTQTSAAISNWASHLTTVTKELQDEDEAVAGVIDKGAPALDESRALVERLQPTLPVIMANLVGPSQVALTYRADLEQILAVYPHYVAAESAGIVANHNTKQPYRGQYLAFNLNLNLPPPCTTGFLPVQQMRNPVFEDYPERPPGDLYCRVPQDSPIIEVRGARNTPCETRPGKRAATVKQCESDEEYVPLNDGWNWKGDANATITGQGIPDRGPGSLPSNTLSSTPAIAAVPYDPATGSYIGPDGRLYTQTDLSQTSEKKTWDSMLVPPGN